MEGCRYRNFIILTFSNNAMYKGEQNWIFAQQLRSHDLSHIHLVLLRICDIFLFALLARAGVLVLFNGLLALFFFFICVFREFETFLQLG